MHDIKTLGNHQLGLYYESVDQKLIDIQIEIVENIGDILNNDPPNDAEIYTNPERFHEYCTPYRETIEKEKRELFLMLKKEKQGIQKEIRTRQMQMFEELGFTKPSVRVEIIMQKTEGAYFPVFSDIMRYIKLMKKKKNYKRPKGKVIRVPESMNDFIKKFEKLGTTIFKVLANNEGPTKN